MEIPNPEDYNIFTALLETIHKKDRGRLRFAKCRRCGRLTPFRLISTSSVTVKCKECGNTVPIKTETEPEKKKCPKIVSIQRKHAATLNQHLNGQSWDS